MVYAVARSKEYLEEGYEPDLDGDFKPNMINSVVFLVEAVQQVLLRLYLVLAVVLLFRPQWHEWYPVCIVSPGTGMYFGILCFRLISSPLHT